MRPQPTLGRALKPPGHLRWRAMHHALRPRQHAVSLASSPPQAVLRSPPFNALIPAHSLSDGTEPTLGRALTVRGFRTRFDRPSSLTAMHHAHDRISGAGL